MIYKFNFEGGGMDGEIVLTDYAQPGSETPQSAAWIDFTLGGVVGLSFPVLDRKTSATSMSDAQGGEREGCGQLYQVVYRDEHAGSVLVRCRHIPSGDLVPPGIRLIEFTFEGGFLDGATDSWSIPRIAGQPNCDAARARFRMTESGTIGKRFGAGSAAALQMLKDDGPEATRGTSADLNIYEVTSRIEEGEKLRLHCRFIRSECSFASAVGRGRNTDGPQPKSKS